MVTTDSVMEILRTIPDPEMPISIVDLGLVERVVVDAGGETVSVDLLPTFVGCPALDMIRDSVQSGVGRLAGVSRVTVRFLYDPPWSVDRITTEGRASLREHGVTVPGPGDAAAATVELRTSAVRCPFCGADETRVDSAFGPTRCRMIMYCDACRNAFEHMKRVGADGGPKAPP